MNEKSDVEFFLSLMPSLKKWYNIFLLYSFQLLIFVGVMAFFWWISSLHYFGAVSGQITVSTLLVIFYIYLANNAERIRDKYLKKYKTLAGQAFWYRYQSYTIPIISAAFYFPLLVKTDYFLPSITNLPSHFITNTLFPIYIAIPISIILIFIGLLMRKFTGGYGMDVDDYFYVIYPEKSKLLDTGMYSFIRNPQYLSRGIISIGFGFFANNVSGIIIGLIHFISYCAIIPAEDKELTRRFGDDFLKYKKTIPVLFPKYGKWGDFIRYLFTFSKN